MREIGERIGFVVETDTLRIPSTRNHCMVGRSLSPSFSSLATDERLKKSSDEEVFTYSLPIHRLSSLHTPLFSMPRLSYWKNLITTNSFRRSPSILTPSIPDFQVAPGKTGTDYLKTSSDTEDPPVKNE